MLARLWRALGIAERRRGSTINSIGDPDERRAHRADLIAYFERAPRTARRRREAPAAHESAAHPRLQEPGHAGDDRRRADARRAPRRPRRARTSTACSSCSPTAASPFEIDARLVRGLDYYNRTVFEWVTDRLGAQGTVAGGGRYDGLFEQLGGKPTPACGFAIGVERMILLLQEAGVDGRTRAARLRRPRRRRRVAPRVARRRDAARCGLRRRRQRRRRQLQVADEEGRRLGRALRGPDRRRRSRGADGQRQAAARVRRAENRPVRRPSGGARRTQIQNKERQWQSTISKNRTSSKTSRRGGSSGATRSPASSSPCASASSACRAGAGGRSSRPSRRRCSTTPSAPPRARTMSRRRRTRWRSSPTSTAAPPTRRAAR